MTRDPTPETDWQTLRLWHIQPVRDVLVLVGIIGVIYLGYRLSVVTVPILLALLLAYLFEPLVRRLVRRRWMSRQGSAAAIIVGLLLIVLVPLTVGAGFAVLQAVAITRDVAGNVGLLVRSVNAANPAEREHARAALTGPWRWAGDKLVELREEAGEEPAGTEQDATFEGPPTPEEADAMEEARHVPTWKRGASRGADALLKWAGDNAKTIAKAVGEQAIGSGATALAAVAGLFVSIGYLGFSLFLTAFFFFFFSTGYGRVLEFWEGLIPERKKGRVFDLVERMDGVIAGFVRGRLLIAAVLAGYMVVAYWIIGVPAPFLVGLAAGFLFLLPYISVLGVPLAILLMVLHPGSMAFQQSWYWIVLAPIAVYVVGQLADDYVLSPIIQGRTTGLEAPMILFASIAGGALGGVYGLLLAIPVAACLKILLNEVFWPRVKAWAEGREKDILPIGRE
ncbi:MAG: AI-2E family transporter [Phycisphaerales bacterium]|nr:AI-2E family transporter [Phycisphaerales bacterium]